MELTDTQLLIRDQYRKFMTTELEAATPAMELARDGFPVFPLLANNLQSSAPRYARWPDISLRLPRRVTNTTARNRTAKTTKAMTDAITTGLE